MPTCTKAGASNQWLELEPDYVAPEPEPAAKVEPVKKAAAKKAVPKKAS